MKDFSSHNPLHIICLAQFEEQRHKSKTNVLSKMHFAFFCTDITVQILHNYICMQNTSSRTK